MRFSSSAALAPVALAAVALATVLAGCAIHTSPDRPGGGRLMNDVRVLAADDMQGREVATKGSIQARSYILRRLKQERVLPTGQGWLQSFTFKSHDGQETQGVNVMGFVEGRSHPDEYIVITAHYDHLGVKPDGAVFNGADDNASGVAGLLEIARRLRAKPPEHSVLLVALDGEEEGLKGAQAFVANPPVAREAMVLNINLDMISRLDKGEIYAVGTYQFPALKPPLVQAARGSKVTLLFGRDRPEDKGRNNWVNLSDQEPFYRASVPFIFFSVDDHADYHTPTDDPGLIPIPFYQAAVELIADSLRLFDRMDLRAVRDGPRN